MYSCTICIDNLVGNDAAAALQCGHTFHKKCIDYWLNQSHSKGQCPLCKKKVQKNRMVEQLYFSSNDDSSSQPISFSVNSNDDLAAITATLAQANSAAESLKRTIAELKQENSVVKSDIAKLQQEYNHAKILNENQERELREHQRTKRYLKQIKKVADLDDDLTSRSSKLFLESIKQCTKDELLVRCAALRSKENKSAKERDYFQRKANLAERRDGVLAAKCDRLRAEVKKWKDRASSASTSAAPATATAASTNSFSTTFQPRKSNVIVLDESDDDEEEDEELANIQHSILDQDDDNDYVVEEHNPTVFIRNPKRRRADLSDDEQDNDNPTSRSSKAIKITDTDEDDDLLPPELPNIAGPSSSSDYSA